MSPSAAYDNHPCTTDSIGEHAIDHPDHEDPRVGDPHVPNWGRQRPPVDHSLWPCPDNSGEPHDCAEAVALALSNERRPRGATRTR